MDQVAKRKIGSSINFTLDGKKAILSEANDLFGNGVITLIFDGEYIGAYEGFTIDEVHSKLLSDVDFIDEAYC